MFMNCLTTNVTSVSQLSSQGPETILEEEAERPYEPGGGGGARLEQTISPEHHGPTALMNLTAAVVSVCRQSRKTAGILAPT